VNTARSQHYLNEKPQGTTILQLSCTVGVCTVLVRDGAKFKNKNHWCHSLFLTCREKID
jgi:hypothetical protein